LLWATEVPEIWAEVMGSGPRPDESEDDPDVAVSEDGS